MNDLAGAAFSWRPVFLDSVGSTNDEAKRLARAGAPAGTAGSARVAGGVEHQSARARQNVWPEPRDRNREAHHECGRGLVDVGLHIERPGGGDVLQRVPRVPVGRVGAQPAIKEEAVAGQESASVGGMLGDSISSRVLGEIPRALHADLVTSFCFIFLRRDRRREQKERRDKS